MCKNKIIIKNKRYQPTKKNGYTKKTPRDRRLSYIEIPCGECKECKKKRKEMWRLRIENYERDEEDDSLYRDWETDRKSTRLNSSHRSLSRMPSSA